MNPINHMIPHLSESKERNLSHTETDKFNQFPTFMVAVKTPYHHTSIASPLSTSSTKATHFFTINESTLTYHYH
jgi:hypothetical protein